MSYTDLLSQKEWFFKCNEILRRDYFKCCDCGCLGFHNGGNFMEFNNIAEVDELLKSFSFIVRTRVNDKIEEYEKPFSEFYKKILKRDAVLKDPNKPIKKWDIQCDINLKCGDLIYAHFSKPYVRISLDFDYFPIIFRKGEKPLKVIQHELHGSLVVHNNGYHMYEFLLPYEISSIYVCIEENGYKNYITVQIKDKLFAMVFGKLFKGLNIHHIYYLVGHKPWEYKNEALVTLCEDCHKKRHNQAIPVYNAGIICKYLRSCERCGGSGYLPIYQHVQHGICFKCGGEGVVLDD